MKMHVARQPIYDRKLSVYGYELLYRANDINNVYDPTQPPDEASSRVIIDSFHGLGIDTLVGKKKAFINFTTNLIRQEIATLFPRDSLVIEILEMVQPDDDIMACCRSLRDKGYEIALDDFVMTPRCAPLIGVADIIKIDFRGTELPVIKSLVDRFSKRNIRFLAEKIETHKEFQLAVALGFAYFQGYFLSKPIIISGESLRPIPTNYLRLLHVIYQTEFDLSEVSSIIRQDVSLSYELLRLVNSIAFGFRHRIESVHQAIVALGSQEARKWISLVIMVGMNREKPNELIYISLIRARMMQNLAASANMSAHADGMFLTGLFSMLDVIVGREIADIVSEVPMNADVYAALVDRKGAYAPYLDLVIAQEEAQWAAVSGLASRIKLDLETVQDTYIDATQWCVKVFESPM